MSSRPVIALLTDFGLTDHYVGVMKGVIAGAVRTRSSSTSRTACRRRTSVRQRSSSEASWRYFPRGRSSSSWSILASARIARRSPRESAIASSSDPTTACSTWCSSRAPRRRWFLTTSRDLQSTPVSRTFEGRDRFAPAAAWLAGTPLADLGMSVGLGMRLPWTSPGHPATTASTARSSTSIASAIWSPTSGVGCGRPCSILPASASAARAGAPGVDLRRGSGGRGASRSSAAPIAWRLPCVGGAPRRAGRRTRHPVHVSRRA